MILHLIRHPRPLVAAGICYGRLDLEAENATALAASLRAELPTDLPVWRSPLSRCRALAEALHPQPLIDARLAEMDFGAWEGRSWDTIPRAELDAWAADVGVMLRRAGNRRANCNDGRSILSPHWMCRKQSSSPTPGSSASSLRTGAECRPPSGRSWISPTDR